jgi:hypothetical protein
MRPYRPRDPHDLDAPARSGRIYSFPRQVEGLVRDNRVEVRVLIGASAKAPLVGALVGLGERDGELASRAGLSKQSLTGCFASAKPPGSSSAGASPPTGAPSAFA